MSILPGYVLGDRVASRDGLVAYRAVSAADGRSVVVKTTVSDYPDQKDISVLDHEYAILDALGGDGAPRARALEVGGARRFLIMEDLAGQPPGSLEKDGRIPLPVFLALGAALAEVLGRIHAKGVLVRDVQAENVRYDQGAHRAAFFDLSRALNLDSGLAPATPAGHVPTPPTHLAPELSGRTHREPDWRSDLYALGATLYGLCVGRLPFEDRDPLALLHAHLATPPPRPDALRPDIPPVLSDILQKLLAKDPDDRYQGAFGLKADLEECRRRLGRDGRIRPFALGDDDHADFFRLPGRLYGRDMERGKLLAAIDGLAHGGRRLVLVGGRSGTGKTSLIEESRQPVMAMGGRFVSGKFDAARRGLPFSALAEALDGLAALLLAEPEPVRLDWRRRLRAALGGVARVVVDVVPRLESLIGSGPPLPSLPPEQTKNRLFLAFQAFFREVSPPGRPLALFLDDLQWADAASLELLKALLTDPSPGDFFCLGAYRDNEVEASSPLALTLAALGEAGVDTVATTLGPLDVSATTALLADTLRAPAARVGELADILRCQTWGSPFFLRQTLVSLHARGFFRFDPATRRWDWDIDDIAGQAMADNVAELLARRIADLPEATRRAVLAAACLGGVFEARTLARLCDVPSAGIRSVLAPALRAGLLYTVVSEASSSGLAQADDGEGPRLAFSHDRIQEAALAMQDEDQRRLTHGRAAALLMASLGPEDIERRVVEIAARLNAAVTGRETPLERTALAEWNLRASRKARQAAAFGQALDHARTCLGFLPPDAFETHYELALEAHKECALLEHVTLHFEEAERLYRIGLDRARTPLDRCDFVNMRLNQMCMTGKIPAAVEEAKKELALYGIFIPDADIDIAAGREIERITAIMDGRSPLAFADMPAMTDPMLIAASSIIDSVAPATYFHDRKLLVLFAATVTRLSLEHGFAKGTFPALGSHGRFLVAHFGQYELGHEFGQLAIGLCRKHNVLMSLAVTVSTVIDIAYFFQSIESIHEIINAGIAAAVSTGDLYHVDLLQSLRFPFYFYSGNNILSIYDDITKLYLKQDTIISTIGYHLSMSYCFGLIELIDPEESHLDNTLDEDSFLKRTSLGVETTSLSYYYGMKAIVQYIMGNLDESRTCFDKSGQYSQTRELFLSCDLIFFKSLLLLDPRDGEGTPREEAARELTENRRQLRFWSQTCPENFLARHLLVEAEAARASGKPLEDVMDRYDRSIAAAREHGLTHVAALAEELAGEFWLSRGKPDFARTHLARAVQGYRAWGASRKVRKMTRDHMALFDRPEPLPWPDQAGAADTRLDLEGLDLRSLMKAAGAISGEIVLPRLASTLTHLAAENAGAERCLLILRQGDGLAVLSGDQRPGGDEAVVRAVGPNGPDDVPRGLLDLAWEGGAPLLIDDLSSDARFAADPYVRSRRPRSVLCVPILGRGEVRGLIYLENSLVRGAFTQAKAEAVGILAAQAAISLDNARLYDETSRAGQEVRLLNRQLLRVQETERQKISRDLHDDVAQDLLAANIAVKGLLRGPDAPTPTEARDRLGLMAETLQKAIAKVRDISHALRPPDLDQVGLVASIELMCRDFEAKAGMEVECITAGMVGAVFDQEREINIFRLIQEALNNIHKHARAKRTVVRLVASRPWVRLSIEDDGVGFDVAGPPPTDEGGRRMGLMTMRERAALLGGELAIVSRPGAGARISLEMPYPGEAHETDHPHPSR